MSQTTVGVIGAGTMGRGIVQLMAQAGHRVLCFDAMAGAAGQAVAAVLAQLERAVDKGRITTDVFASMRSSIVACDAIDDLRDSDVVIEAIVEDLDVKRKLFASLESIVRDDAILASNTSSLTVSEIASACRLPQRVAGLHFFNPVPLMKVAEVIAAVRTSPATVATLSALVAGAGHRAVVTADQPGFLINHAGRGLYTEGLRLLEEQVATADEVDVVLREAAGFRMGPFELLDLTGLDVSSKVMTSIYEQFAQEPRFRPSSLVPPRVAAGLFGRKTGEGWYRYVDGKPVLPQTSPLPDVPVGAVWIDPHADDAQALKAMVTEAGGRLVTTPDGDALLIVQPWGFDATSHCAKLGLDAQRCVAVDPLPGLGRHRTLMLTAVTGAAHRDAARALFSHDGVAATVVNDSPGFVVQRVLATIVNIAANIAQRGIAAVADLEAAVQLGLGYPKGPLAWGDEIGGARVLAILRHMQMVTGDPRYRPSPWLVRRVELGLSLLTPECGASLNPHIHAHATMNNASHPDSIYDVAVIGAGAGGLCAAARLTAAGKKVLVLESRDRVGGRASSEQIDGFTVNIGAIAIERGGVFEETFAQLGVELDLREPSPATVFRIDHKLINVSKGGGWGLLLGGFTKQAARIGAKFADARGGDLPEAKLSTQEWLAGYTKNETVHAIFRNLCAAIFAANADELPARAFLTYFAVKGAFKRFGFCPRGTIGIWNDLADGIRARGGDIWLKSAVSGLHVEEGRVTAIDVVQNGETQRIAVRSVISNMGPAATARLAGAEAFGAAYVAEATTLPKPAANIVINFATRERLVDAPGLVTFGKTRRLCNLGELTATCPELAPEGWHLYVAYAVPRPAIGDFDEATEVEASLQDLRDEFPSFDQARMLSIRVMRGEWPAQRSCAGYDLSQDTPIPNLWHVGDAVKDYGDGGTQACAFTARVAAERALAMLGGVAR